jgi:uncharacterized phage-associated protein
MYDARAVANCIIELALEYEQKLTHLSLQKILYFIHGKYLVERNAPLVGGHFEAWQYGPVHPLIFSTFKETRGENITDIAKRVDVFTGERLDIDPITDKDNRLFIRANAAQFLGISAGRLVDLSHAAGSPWDVLTKRDHNGRIFGDRITNDLIAKYYHRHIISIRDKPNCGDPDDERPPT